MQPNTRKEDVVVFESNEKDDMLLVVVGWLREAFSESDSGVGTV